MQQLIQREFKIKYHPVSVEMKSFARGFWMLRVCYQNGSCDNKTSFWRALNCFSIITLKPIFSSAKLGSYIYSRVMGFLKFLQSLKVATKKLQKLLHAINIHCILYSQIETKFNKLPPISFRLPKHNNWR